MKISYDAAIEIAQDMIKNGEVNPNTTPMDLLNGPTLLVTFHAYVPLNKIEEDGKGESNE